jgi:hypothetical protein
VKWTVAAVFDNNCPASEIKIAESHANLGQHLFRVDLPLDIYIRTFTKINKSLRGNGVVGNKPNITLRLTNCGWLRLPPKTRLPEDTVSSAASGEVHVKLPNIVTQYLLSNPAPDMVMIFSGQT